MPVATGIQLVWNAWLVNEHDIDGVGCCSVEEHIGEQNRSGTQYVRDDLSLAPSRPVEKGICSITLKRRNLEFNNYKPCTQL